MAISAPHSLHASALNAAKSASPLREAANKSAPAEAAPLKAAESTSVTLSDAGMQALKNDGQSSSSESPLTYASPQNRVG